MAKAYQLEFYVNGDAIDLKDFDSTPHIPKVGEKIYLSCENPNMNDYGPDYEVIDSITLFFTGERPKQKIMLKLKKIDKPDW